MKVTEFTAEEISTALNIAKRVADERREQAGHGGHMTDLGASWIDDAVRIWNAGRNGVVPKELRDYFAQARFVLDPEYDTYQRLRKKFG